MPRGPTASTRSVARTALARNGAGTIGAAELVQHDRQLGVARPATTESCGDVDARPPELDHLVPECAIESGCVTDHRAHAIGGRLVEEEVAYDGTQFAAFVRRQGHPCSYRGSPSVRSPMMFRMISLVPPPMAQPKEWT